MSVYQQIEAARAGNDPALICKVPSGWVVLCQMQFLPGYCVLLADPIVESLNDLTAGERLSFLSDMALIGDSLLAVTGAYRINYAIMGNSDPILHAHIVPRYASEPEHLRTGLPWSYSAEIIDTMLFDLNTHQEMIQNLASAIQKRLQLRCV